MVYAIIVKRGTLPDFVQHRFTYGQAYDCAFALADLHGLNTLDIDERMTSEGQMAFVMDASRYYQDKGYIKGSNDHA